MAHRLATEYVKAQIKLSKNQLDQFIQMVSEHYAEFKIKQISNEEIHMILNDEGSEIVLMFIKHHDKYICQDSYRIRNHQLANMMRKVMLTFKGDAIVNRIYSNFTMVYYYNHGSVVRIKEIKDKNVRLVYEFKNTALQLQTLFEQREVEDTIETVKLKINQLLDDRIKAHNLDDCEQIDQMLKDLSHQLFVLEA